MVSFLCLFLSLPFLPSFLKNADEKEYVEFRLLWEITFKLNLSTLSVEKVSFHSSSFLGVQLTS